MKERVLVIGSGGREHAICRRLLEECEKGAIHAWPGNAGMRTEGIVCQSGNVSDFKAIGEYAIKQKITLMVVGPEQPLVEGIVDYFEADSELREIPIVGPTKDGAQLEGSKSFAKGFMARHGIPTAPAKTFVKDEIELAKTYLRGQKPPYVLKADGLAAGKGVAICQTLEEAEETLKSYFSGRFQEAGQKVVIEKFLTGIEVSVFALTDGEHYAILPAAKDYKRAEEGDKGPNTGGMGAISPVPFADAEFMERVEREIIKPTIDGLVSEGLKYRGFIFFGLMREEDGTPQVIEYNARMGDPETQAVLFRMKEPLLPLLKAAATGTMRGNFRAKEQPFSTAAITIASAGYPETSTKGIPIELPTPKPDTSYLFGGVGEENGKLVTAGGRVLYACGKGENLQKAVAKAYSAAERVKIEGSFYRRDIGNDLAI